MEKPLEALENKNIDKLYIIPDKHLNYLPFELLISELPVNKKANYKSLHYLLKDYSISYGYSSSILFRDKGVNPQEEDQKDLLAIAPSYESILKDTLQLASLGKFRDGFQELLFNTKEVKDINQYYSGKTLTGENATKKEFSNNLNNYKIIHLAMHALVDNEDSDNSKLVFSSSKDSVEDNYLYNFELYNSRISTKLAVLSACNTGMGDLKGGEGIMSMARAFTYAGAESVVMSHWRVEDQSSSIIMKKFYQYMSEGMSKDESLRLAKLEFLEEAPANLQHPFHWGNFVVFGDTVPIPAEKSFLLRFWWFLLIPVMLVLYFFYQRRMKAHNKLQA